MFSDVLVAATPIFSTTVVDKLVNTVVLHTATPVYTVGVRDQEI